MSLAKIADTTIIPVTRAIPTRRSLFDGAAAVVLGGGITARVAASAADFLTGEGADAVLLALCTHAKAADDRSMVPSRLVWNCLSGMSPAG